MVDVKRMVLILICGFLTPAAKSDHLADLRKQYDNLDKEAGDIEDILWESFEKKYSIAPSKKQRLINRKDDIRQQMNAIRYEIQEIEESLTQAAQRSMRQSPLAPPTADTILIVQPTIPPAVEEETDFSDVPELITPKTYVMLVKTIAHDKKIEVVVGDIMHQEKGFIISPLTPEQKSKSIDCTAEPTKALRLYYTKEFTKAKTQKAAAFALPLVTCLNNQKDVGIALDTATQALKSGSLKTIRFIIPEDDPDLDELYQICVGKLGILPVSRVFGG